MTNHYRKITTVSWGKRIARSFAGIIFGILLFIAAFPLLWWNEGRSIDRTRTLAVGRDLVVSVPSENIDPNHNGALIYLSGRAVTDDILEDKAFGVQENALKLQRTVEMYQWKENRETKSKKNTGGSTREETTYSYEKTWSETHIDSSEFERPGGHENPSSMPYESHLYTASPITVGAFTLTSAFAGQIKPFALYPLSEQNFMAMDERFRQAFTLYDNHYYYGSPINPPIGAVRIRYGIIKSADVSVIGKQEDNAVKTYYTKNGDIALLEPGHVSAVSMFTAAENKNTLLTWIIRFGAFFMMWLGLALILAPLKIFTDVIPWIGTLIGAGMGFVTGAAALIFSFTTMALAWVFYRPWIGITLLIVVGALFFGGWKKIRSARHPMAAQ